MKKLLILIVISILTISANAQKLKRTYYDPYSKTMLMEKYYVNSAGYGNGSYKKYDKKGSLIYKGTYKNGGKEGTWTQYSSYSGKLEVAQVETFKGDVLNGPAKYYGSYNGKNIVIREGDYLDGEKHGKWMILDGYTNYSLTEEEKKGCDYVKSYPVFNKGRIDYPDGEVKTHYYPSGKLRSIQNYKGGKKVGKQVWYLPDGSVESEEFYEDIEALEEMYLDSALTAFKNHEFKSAANYFSKMKNPQDAEIMIKLSKSKEYRKDKNYPEAIQSIKMAARGIENDIILDYYIEVYKEYISEVESKFTSYKETFNVKLSEETLRDCQISKSRGILKKEDLDRFIALHSEVEKKLEEKLEQAEKLTQEIIDAKAKYEELYGPPSYSRSSRLYDASSPILYEMIRSYNAETDDKNKKETGQEILKALKTMNSYSPDECKDLKKAVRKADSQEEIRKVLSL